MHQRRFFPAVRVLGRVEHYAEQIVESFIPPGFFALLLGIILQVFGLAIVRTFEEAQPSDTPILREIIWFEMGWSLWDCTIVQETRPDNAE
jgi:hypothetical protein